MNVIALGKFEFSCYSLFPHVGVSSLKDPQGLSFLSDIFLRHLLTSLLLGLRLMIVYGLLVQGSLCLPAGERGGGGVLGDACPTVANARSWKRDAKPFRFWSCSAFRKQHIQPFFCADGSSCSLRASCTVCWYGNRLPDFTSRAVPQHFLLTIYGCWFKIPGVLSSLLPLPLRSFKVNLFFFLQSHQVIFFPTAFSPGALPPVQHTPL